MTNNIADILAARWYNTLLGFALKETDDPEAAVRAADLAFSLEPPPGGQAGVDFQGSLVHPPPRGEHSNPTTPAFLPADIPEAEFGWVSYQGSAGWYGAKPPGKGWTPVIIPEGGIDVGGRKIGARGGKLWTRQGHVPKRGGSRKRGQPAQQPPQQGQQPPTEGTPSSQTPQQGQQQPQGEQKPTYHGVLNELLKDFEGIKNGTVKMDDAYVKSLAMTLPHLTVKEINDLKRTLKNDHNFKVTGSGVKQQLIQRVAESALTQARALVPMTPAQAAIHPEKVKPIPKPEPPPQPAPEPKAVNTPQPEAVSPPIQQPLTEQPIAEEPKGPEDIINAHPKLSKVQKSILNSVMRGESLEKAGENAGLVIKGRNKRALPHYHLKKALERLRKNDPQFLEGLEDAPNVAEEEEPERTAEGVSQELRQGQRRGRPTGGRNIGTGPIEEGEEREEGQERARSAQKKAAKITPEERRREEEWNNVTALTEKLLSGEISEEELDRLESMAPRKKGGERGRKPGQQNVEGIEKPADKVEGNSGGTEGGTGPKEPATSSDKGDTGGTSGGTSGGAERTPEPATQREQPAKSVASEPVKAAKQKDSTMPPEVKELLEADDDWLAKNFSSKVRRGEYGPEAKRLAIEADKWTKETRMKRFREELAKLYA